MVGFEILVNVPRDKRQEFLQTCELLGYPDHRDPACTKQVLFESVLESNQFLWVEHWSDRTRMKFRDFPRVRLFEVRPILRAVRRH